MNKLFYGDNLNDLRKYIKDETIDLCYIDPPFNSKRNYNQIYNNIGSEDMAQAQAFEDTWVWDSAADIGLEEILSNKNNVFTSQSIELIIGLTNVLKKGSLLAYLVHIELRVAEIYRVLKPTGSFYLHCDPSASHYLKLVIDSIFCSRSGLFQNEIIWRRTSSHNSRRSFGPIHDVILFYTKTEKYTFNIVKRPYMRGHVESRYSADSTGKMKFTSGGNILTGSGKTGGDSGKIWRGFDPSVKRRHWAVPGFLTEDLDEDFQNLGVLEKLESLYNMGRIDITGNNVWPTPVRYLKDNDGQPIQDIWAYQPYTDNTVYGTKKGIDDDVAWLGTTSPERLGYPTQKPEGLMERIIKASSNEGDTILDAYCGCGTTIVTSQKLNRKWIGIDITYQSISLVLKRLSDSFGTEVSQQIELNGVPRDFDSAVALAHKKEDKTRKEFEKWAVLTYSNNLAIINETKGGDGGIDGILYIRDIDEKRKEKRIKVLFSVKSNKKLTPSVIRDLSGTMQREGSEMGVLITLYPMANLKKEGKKYGTYNYKLNNQNFSKISVINVRQLLDGERIHYAVMDDPLKRSISKEDAIQPTLDMF